jgi:hypothetical protein
MDDLLDQTISHYRVISLLGAGGMGIMGNYEGTLDILEKHFLEEAGGKAVVERLKKAYATGGAGGYWRTLLELESFPRASGHKNPLRLAMIHTKLGEREKALTLLERAFAEHEGDMAFVNIEPCFDPLHGEPRFQALVRRVGPTPRA